MTSENQTHQSQPTSTGGILRRFAGRGRLWVVMAAVLMVFGLFFDDLVQFVLTDAKSVRRQTAPAAVENDKITNVTTVPDPQLLDSAFVRAVTKSDGVVLADFARPADESQTVVETAAASESVDSVSMVENLIHSLDAVGSLTGRDALSAAVLMLETGRDRLASVDTYTATFDRREFVAGEMRDEERINLKVRHAPFGVYMKWLTGDAGREVLYNANQLDGCLLIRLGGFKGRILPSLKLDPYGSRAMRSSRHPITECGLLELCKLLVDFRRSDLVEEKQVDCELLADANCDGRDAYFMRIEYADQSQSSVYRKTDLHIDRETLLPVCIWNYTWPADGLTADDDTLIEYYQFTDVVLNQNLTATDFESTNSNYRFSR